MNVFSDSPSLAFILFLCMMVFNRRWKDQWSCVPMPIKMDFHYFINASLKHFVMLTSLLWSAGDL